MKTLYKQALVARWQLAMNYSLLIAFSLLLATACSKKLKAGDPLPITYSNVYLIGNATTAAWTIANALPMTPVAGSPNMFTWTGPLTTGEIKFPTALNFSSDSFMAATAGQSVTINKAQLSPGGNPDIHWKLASTDAGTYKITLNTADVTVTFQKQ